MSARSYLRTGALPDGRATAQTHRRLTPRLRFLLTFLSLKVFRSLFAAAFSYEASIGFVS